MRFAVQQLLDSAAALDPFTRVLQGDQEEMPVGLGKRGGLVSVGDKPFSLGGSVQEARSCDLDASHPHVQAMERVCVCAW